MPAGMDALAAAAPALFPDGEYSPARLRAHSLVAALPRDAEHWQALPRAR